MKILALFMTLAAGLLSAAGSQEDNHLFLLAGEGMRVGELSAALGEGAVVERRNRNGWTPLMLAAAKGNLPAVELLLEAGADPSAASRTEYYSGFSALMTAAYYDHPDVIEALVAAGAEVNAADNHYYGETALMLAVKTGNIESVRSLIAGGAEVNTANRRGVTALMYAASYGRVEIIKALLEAGADPEIRDQEGMDAFRWSILAGSRRAAVRHLLEQ